MRALRTLEGARIHIIGTGLLGTSLGLALRRQGIAVTLADVSPTAVQLATDMGAGEPAGVQDEPHIVVVATPPDVSASVIVAALQAHPQATVTDVASVKTILRDRVAERVDAATLRRYIGSHPMAGRERSGAISARADLFESRPWVICSDQDTEPARLEHIEALARVCQASVTHLDPEFHDSSVARVSHAPHVMAAIMAAELSELPFAGIALAGQGVRDMTRIAASDPVLWTQILQGNARDVHATLEALRDRLDGYIAALAAGSGHTAELAGYLSAGNEGQRRIPGKHGQAPLTYSTVGVIIGDRPGDLAKLLGEISDMGINVEDIRLDHAPEQRLGSVWISVLPVHTNALNDGLRQADWRIIDTHFTNEGQA